MGSNCINEDQIGEAKSEVDVMMKIYI